MHERSDARKSRLEREAAAAADLRARVMAARIEAFAEEMAARSFIAAVDAAESKAHTDHVAGVCGDSEWSCSDCERGALA